jgi:O-succinylbenzoic acid--CoA ligase
MKIDWSSPENILLLNPRLPQATRDLFETSWRENVEAKFQNQIGIATSGSSGDSHGKLIILSKQAVLTNAGAVNERLDVKANDIWMKTLPDFHVGGMGIYARASLNGAGVFESRLERWQGEDFYKELLQSKATLLALVPTQLFDLVALGLQAPKTVRALVIGGGRLERSLREQALRLGWPVLVSYGCTECCSQIATAQVSDDERMMPLSHVELRIGEDERLEIKSRALLTGQIGFENGHGVFVDPKVNGWFRTEDRARLEADGSLTIMGRTVDFVKIGGEGVVMSRLEERLERLRLDLKFDAAILAARDDRLGARVILIAAAPAFEAQVLAAKFNEDILPFERARDIFSVTEIPRSPLGKLLRAQALALVGLESPTDFSGDRKL